MDATCTNPVYSNILTITVRPALSGGVIEEDQTICYGGDPARFDNVTAASGGGGSFTYLWFYTTNMLTVPGDADWTSIPSATGTGYNHGTLNTTTKFVRRAIDATCSTPVYSNQVTVTVHPQLNGGTIASSQTICYNDNVPAFESTEDATGGAGLFTYTWFYTTSTTAVPGGPGWTTVPSSNSTVYDHGTLTATTRFVRRAVDASCTTPVYSNVITVTVRPELTGGGITASQTICYGDDVTAFSSTTAAGGGAGAFTYSWLSTTNMTASPGDPAWNEIPSTNALIYDHGTLTATTRFVRKAVESTCTTPVYSNILTVTVRPELSGGVIADDQTICYGADVAVFSSTDDATGGAGNFTYTWQYTTNLAAITGDGTWTDIPSSDNETYNHGTLTATTKFVRMAVDASCSTPVYSNEVTVTVRPEPDGGTIAAAQVICSGGDPEAFTSIDGATGSSGSFTYTWLYNTNPSAVPGGPGWIEVPSSNSTVYDHGTLTTTTLFVRRAVDAVCLTPVYSNVIEVTVMPALYGGVISASQSVCYGDDPEAFTSLNDASGGTGAFTYTWQYTTNMAATAGDANWTDINDSDDPGYDHGVLLVPTRFVRKATDLACSNPVYSNILTVAIDPLPVTSEITGESILCEDSDDQIYRVVNTSGSAYFWTVPASFTIISPQGYNVIIVQVNGTTNPGDVITVTETNTATDCVGDPVEFPVTVLPVMPLADVTGPSVVCQGDAGVIYSVPDNPGSTYAWFVPAGASITSDPSLHQIEVTFSMAISGQIACIETSNLICTTVHNPAVVTVNTLPGIYTVSATPYYCYGTDGVTVTLSNSQAGVNYQLLKDGVAEGSAIPGTGSSITWPDMKAGIYMVRAASATSPVCEVLMNGNPAVEENPEIVISSITITEPKCYGSTDGSIVINASGGFPPLSTLTYSINGGTTFFASNTFTNVGQGTYNIVVKDLRNCTVASAPVTVNQPSELTITSLTVTTPVNCNGSSTGSVRVFIAGGTPLYSYQWYYDQFFASPIPGQISADATGLPAGTYYVKVTDINGCWKSGSITLTQPPAITGSGIVSTAVSCYGINDAIITVTATGGSGSLEYDLNGLNIWNNTGVFSGLGAGTYSIRVRDALAVSCIVNLQDVVITQPSELLVSVTSQANVLCFDGTTGAIGVTVSGGTLPAGGYLFSWTGSDYLGNAFTSTSEDLNGLKAGSYGLTVTDANGCTAILPPVTITQPPVLAVALDSQTNVLCYGETNGSITVTATGGAGPYTYAWTGTNYLGGAYFSPAEDISGLRAGTYNLRVTDANGCQRVLPAVIVTQPVALVLVVDDKTNVLCYDDATGAINVTVTGGVMPAGGYLYEWTGTDYLGNLFNSTLEDLASLKAGNYALTVTDANNCEITLPAVSITQPPDLTVTLNATVDVLCHDVATGAAYITVSGGVQPIGGYSFSWSGTDYLGNLYSSTVEDPSGLKAGTYDLVVTDQNGCTATLSDVVINQPPDLTVITEDQINVLCYNGTNGEIDVTVSGGVMPAGGYIYSWTGADYLGTYFASSSEDLTGLKAGTYNLAVRDANSCSVILPAVIITQPAAFTVSLDGKTDILCYDESTGSINVTVAGGVEPAGGYLFTWTGTDYTGTAFTSTDEDLTGLKAGTYLLSVGDANNCTVNLPAVTITQPADLTVSVNSQANVLCFDGTTGAISVTISGGTLPAGGYLFSWTGSDYLGNAFTSTSEDLNGLKAGSYGLTVTDANGCTAILPPVTISQPPVLAVALDSQTNVLCYGETNGSITVTATGGAGPYTYAWTGTNYLGGAYFSSAEDISGLRAGTYNLRVTDANGCQRLLPAVIVTQPVALVLVVDDKTNVLCHDDATGAINVTVTGGVMPAGGYIYEWTGTDYLGNLFNSTLEDLADLKAGNYALTVTDANNCEITMPAVSITQPPDLTVTLNATVDVLCHDAATGAAYITVSGGVQPIGGYSFSWSGTDYLGNLYSSTVEDPSGLKAGTYDLVVTDQNGCTATLSDVVINQPPDLTVITEDQINVLCYNGTNGEIDVTVSGGVMPAGGYIYSWTGADYLGTYFASSSEDLTGLKAGTYNLTVRDNNNCIVTLSTVTITQPPQFTVIRDDQVNILCHDGATGEINVTVSGGVIPAGGYIYEWTGTDYLGNSFSSADEDLAGLKAGIYSLTVTDANGCEAVLPLVSLTQPPDLTVTLLSVTNVMCHDAATGAINVNVSGGVMPAGGYTYTWTGTDYLNNAYSGSTEDPSGLKAGTYDLTVTDNNMCTVALSTVTVSQPDDLTVVLEDQTNVLCYDAATGAIDITAAGGVMPSGGYYYTWTGTTYQGGAFNSNMEDLTGIKAGTYNLTVRDANGCSVILPAVIITQPAAFTVSLDGKTDILCYDESTGSINVTVAGGVVPAGGYLFTWTGTDYTGTAFTSTDEDLTGLKAGTYLLSVGDANNCTVNLPAVTITQPADLAVSVNSQANVLCFGEATGAIYVTVSGGTIPAGGYLFNWTGTDYMGNSYTSNDEDLAGLYAGTYNLTVTDQNGCNVSILPVTITAPLPLVIDVNVTSNYNGRDISCTGAFDGRATATVTGGTGIYFYTWYSDPGFSVPIGQMAPSAINLAAGEYYVRVMDMNGCSITGSVTLTDPPLLDASVVTLTNVDCFNNATGAVTVEAVTGSGTGPYSYSKDGGFTWQPAGEFTGLSAMTYTILVRDANNCIKAVPVIITQPSQLIATISDFDNVSCSGGNDGSVTITVPAGSGTAPYTYTINGTDWQPGGAFTGLTAGSYNIEVRDDNNCSVILPVIISEPPLLELNPTADIVLDCYDDHDGTGTFYAVGGTPGYTFTQILNGADATFAAQGYNSQIIFNAGAGVVTVMVTDSKGCNTEASITFTEPDILEPGSIGNDQVLCYGESPAALVQIDPPDGGPLPFDFKFQWQYSATGSEPFLNISGAVQEGFTPDSPATGTLYYRRMVTSGFCQPVYSNIVEVLVNPRPIAVLRGGETICPGETSVLTIDIMSGTGPFEIDIDPIGTISYEIGDEITVTPVITTTYSLLRVRDANNCEVVSPSPNLGDDVTVFVSDLPDITSFNPSLPVCEFSFATFNVEATGTNLTYQWWVDEGEGAGFVEVEDGATYFGAQTNTLLIFTAMREMDGYVYRVVVSGCGVEEQSVDAVFRVNTAPELTLHPRDTVICLGQDAVMEAEADGDGIEWQWFVNRGTGFEPVADDGVLFSGAETQTLTITSPPYSASPWIFRAIANGSCGVPVYTNFAVMRVLNPPLVTRQPESDPVCENSNIMMTGNGTGFTSLQWQVNISGTWTDITDDLTYLGARSQQLNIMGAPLSFNGNQYRLALITSCATVYTDVVTLTVNANPTVNFLEDPVFACGGVDEIIDGNPAGGSGIYTRHRWTGDVGPLNNYTVQAPVFNSLIPGDYNLTYRVEDSNGCVASDDIVVTVDSPSALFTQDKDYGCTPLAVTFTSDMTDIVKWWWDFDDGSPLDSINDTPVHTFVNNDPTSIQYRKVTLKVLSAGGCYATFESMVIVYPGIDATFTPDTDIICSGNSINFAAAPGASRYFWDFGDLSSGYATGNTSHLYINHGTGPVVYTVRLITTSFYNCIDEATYNITVMPVPIPQFTAEPAIQVFNPAGSDVTFTNETNDGSWTWLWKFGDGETSTEENPVHNYMDVGEFVVTLIAGNASCSDSVSHTVTVLPIPPVADFDSIPSGCAPLYVQINNTSLNTEAPGTTFRWSFGDGSYSTAKNPTYTYFTPGTYRIELTVTGPGGTSIVSQVVNAYPSPKAYFEVTPILVYVNDERVRCFNLSQGANSFLWEFGDGDTSKMREPYHKYMEEGVYDITLWAYSDNGCTDKYVLSPGVTVEPPGELRFATVFTPNKEGPIERTDLPTGGTEIDQFFFPPIRQKVLDYKLQIFNRWGVLIFESHDINVPWNGYYNGTLCQQGVYVWYVEGKFSDGKPYRQVGDVTLLH